MNFIPSVILGVIALLLVHLGAVFLSFSDYMVGVFSINAFWVVQIVAKEIEFARKGEGTMNWVLVLKVICSFLVFIVGLWAVMSYPIMATIIIPLSIIVLFAIHATSDGYKIKYLSRPKQGKDND